MICKHCGTEIADKALICYRCGHATAEPRIRPPAEGSLFERRRRSRLPLVVVAILILLAVLAGWLLGAF
ncbi:MAG TPA: zinc ribbon domain-containing protein [Vicinamibacterales bacterium]|nr:zinc ribbon domain-containing protein [Vicinamibacterales bacterium]